MRKLFPIIYLATTLTSFSFWKMKGIYEKPNSHLGDPTVFKESDIVKTDQEYYYCFLYDKHTNNQLIRRINIKIEKVRFHALPKQNHSFYKQTALKFLKTNFTYNQAFWSQKNSSNRLYMIVGMQYLKCPLLIRYPEIFQGKYKYTIPEWVEINEFLTSQSGVKIQNTEKGVILKINDKQIDLTTALRNYFVESIDLYEFGDTFAQSYNTYFHQAHSQKLLDPLLYRMNQPSLKNKHFNCLKTSTILAVWHLVPTKTEDSRIIESQMIGLARDERTKKLFHWTTDLKEDIGILMQYASTKL